MLSIFRLSPFSLRFSKVFVEALLAIASCSALTAQSGNYLITTVAGSGSPGFSGDGGPATSAQLKAPNAVAIDLLGNLYVADKFNFRIRKITSQGTITTVAGNGTPGFSGDGGPAVGASLNYPSGVAVDSSGNIFIADTSNFRVRMVTPGGTITTVAGNGRSGSGGDGGPAISAQLVGPWGVAVDSLGNLVIADGANSKGIRKVTPQGTITTLASTNSPVGVAVDSSGNLYVADAGDSRIRKITPQGAITTVAGNGTPGFSGDGGPAVGASLNYPSGVAVDSSGNVFIADTSNFRIRMVTPGGTITTVAGNGTPGDGTDDGGPAIAAGLNFPRGVAADSSGKLTVATNSTVRRLVATSTSGVGCVYSLDQSAQSFDAAGGSSSVSVLASSSNCPWLAISYADWITVSPSSTESGIGLVTYTVRSNPASTSRTGVIWIAGRSLTVSQSGVSCSLGVAPLSVSVAASGMVGGSVSVASNASDCPWNAAASVPWILVSGGATGSGNGTVAFSVGINTGTVRTGAITIAGQKVYINQAAAGGSISSLASISGVVNAASYSAPIVPGGFVSAYGQNLAEVTMDWNSAITNGKLPTSLGGIQLLINGKNAFLYYASGTQVNAIAPPDTATGPVEVDVVTSRGTVPVSVNTAPISPGLFSYPLQGTLYAAAVFAADGAYVAAAGAMPGITSRPAKAGDYVLLFATGLGPTNPPYPVGQILTEAYPVPDLSQVSVLIGGTPAAVSFAGMTYPGLYQINIQIPNGIGAGDQLVVLDVGDQGSQPKVYLTFGGG